MKNIFEAIRVDHEIQRTLLKKIVETTGESEERKRLYQKIKHELHIHEDAEERFFYKPLIATNMQEDARHGVAEHHEIDELLEQLDDAHMDESNWLKIAKDLQHKVEHHLEDEEKEFFQKAGKILDEKEKTTLAKKYVDFIEDKRDN